MKLTARGWKRNMGTTELADIDLSELKLNKDERRTLWWGKPALFGSFLRAEVHWARNIKMTGDYRLQLHFSERDALRLLKATYGMELGADLLEEHGFTISDELRKAVLRTLKLTDLTLGDLAAITTQPDGGSIVEQSAQTAELKGR